MIDPSAKSSKPYLITLKSVGDSSEGYLTIAEENINIPFDIKRVFWSYYTPELVTRGRHAHYKLEQVIVAVTGKIVVTNETKDGEIMKHELDKPNIGLYIPPMWWHVIQFSQNAVMMSLSSTLYNPDDYINEYDTFLKLNKQ